VRPPKEAQPVSLEQEPVQTPVEVRVRRQVAELEGIEHRPLGEHAERYDQVHAELQAALSDIDGAAEG
jgi:hypothetical protein